MSGKAPGRGRRPSFWVWNLWMALAMIQKFAESLVGFLQSSEPKTSRSPLDIEGGLRLFNTLAFASSKFSSPPSGLSVLAPSATKATNSFFSE